jgi:hypothetical protein
MPEARDKRFTEEQIAELTNQLRSRSRGVRDRATFRLAGVDLEQFERPPRVSLLLAALNSQELQDRARDSLARVLRGLDDAKLLRLGQDERNALRQSINLRKPHRHAEFLVEVVRTLLHLGDTGAILGLERLVERSAIRKKWSTPLRYDSSHIMTTFEGAYDEEHAMHRVHNAAHTACERLRLLAEKVAQGATLLHPASAPEDEQLVRPASTSTSDPDQLLRAALRSDGNEV